MTNANRGLSQLAAEVKSASSTINNHEVRIAVIENTLTIARNSSRLTLPGN